MKAKTAFLASEHGAFSNYQPGYTACLSEGLRPNEFYITYAKGGMPPFCTDYFKSLDEAIRSFERSYPDANWHPIFDNQ